MRGAQLSPQMDDKTVAEFDLAEKILPFPNISSNYSVKLWQSKTRFHQQDQDWVTYDQDLQDQITAAFRSRPGEPFRFRLKNRDFQIHFDKMIQINKDQPGRIRDVRCIDSEFRRWFFVQPKSPWDIHELDEKVSKMLDHGLGERKLVDGAVCYVVRTMGKTFLVDLKGEKAYEETAKELIYHHLLSLPERVCSSLRFQSYHYKLPPTSPIYQQLDTIFLKTKGRLTRTLDQQELKVVGITCHLNRQLIIQFYEQLIRKSKSSPNTRIIFGFHGTTPDNLNEILRSNFSTSKISSAHGNYGWFGKGIYFSEHAFTALAYNSSSMLLLCMLVVSNTFVCPEPHSYLNPYHGKDCVAGYDSHYSPSKKELVIFNVKQVLPCFVLNLNSGQYDRGSRSEPGQTRLFKSPLSMEFNDFKV